MNLPQPRFDIVHYLDFLTVSFSRARESRTSAEVEVLSSTSNEVCELWSRNEVVRVAGQPPIKELIRCLDRATDPTAASKEPQEQECIDLASADEFRKYNVQPAGKSGRRVEADIEQQPKQNSQLPSQSHSQQAAEPIWKKQFAKCAPNLSLNIERGTIGNLER